jgi:hypothetical protein
MKNAFPTARELAEEAREAFRRNPLKPGELFDGLVRLGLINTKGEVTKLLGGDAEPEAVSANGDETTTQKPAS